jgi:hypothetical protein
MIKTWQQRVYKSLLAYYNVAKLSREDVSIVCRAPYFGEYRYSLHFSPTVLNWTRFDELVKNAATMIAGRGKLTYNPATLQINLFGNDPQLLRDMVRLDEMQFNSIHVIDESCWHWRLPPPKPKGLYYGRYRFRVRFKDRKWAENQKNIAELSNVTADWMLCHKRHTRRNFLYCASVRDVILAKLLFSDDIAEISDRSRATAS